MAGKRVPREGNAIVADGKPIGQVTSGTFSPTLARSIALARVPRGVAPGSVVHVQVRDKQLGARVVKLPFVRKGKILVELKETA